MFQENGIIFFYLAGTLFIALLVGFILFYIYIHHLKVKQMQSEFAQQELKKQQELYFALQAGEEKERKRLAEELHDGIGAKLSGLKMNLEYLQSNVTTQSIQQLLPKLVHEMDESINEIRELSQNLKPAFISAQNFKQVLTQLIEKLTTAAPIDWHIEVSVVDDPPLEMKLSMYRIISELLNNVCKHAKATKVFLNVIQDEGSYQIVIEDNGVGFKTNAPQLGNGLPNLKSRVQSLQGTVAIDSSTKGTTIIIDVPLSIQ